MPPLLRTLHGRLAAILLGLLCLAACFAVPLWLSAAQRYRQEVDQNVNRPLASSLAAHLSELGLLRSENPATLAHARSEIKRLMVINPEIDVYLLDERGRVMDYSGDSAQVLRDRVDPAPLKSFLAGKRPLPILGDDPRAPGERKVFSVASYPNLHRGGSGYVYVILGGEHYESVAGLLGKSYIVRSSVYALAALFAAVALIGLILFRVLTLRLRRLAAAMDSFRADDFQERRPEFHAATPGSFTAVGKAANDEIDRLSGVFGDMSERIEAQVRRLALADRNRREMVGNVSHDLRTPLAALQGYLETLLMKEGAMTSVEQRGYLNVALRQSHRLASLVDQLFELARLDASEVAIHAEPFSISELAQDIVQQHRLAAQEKRIRLEAVLPEDLPFVCADIALVERVFHNLLENALRYTPEGGTATILLAHRSGAVEVAVSDNGSGIAPGDLPHIFERFYRASHQPDPSGAASRSAGLGLAIAKRILELHGSEIAVASVPGELTSFSFQLPLDTDFAAEPLPR